jgi:hypothetical protein
MNTTATTPQTKREQRNFEFTLYLNDNIIVQRFFNVLGFNQNAINSINFKDVIDYNMETIKQHLKNKSLDYIDDNRRFYFENPSYDQLYNNDKVRMVIKMGTKVISYREWDATIYPVKVRSSVDVREHIYSMISKIQRCLCERDDRLETSYLSYDLSMVQN